MDRENRSEQPTNQGANEESEKEFLKNYRADKYPRPSMTSDLCIFKTDISSARRSTLSILLVRRARHPFRDCFALTGGFANPDETIEACALREANEETGIVPRCILPVGIFSEPSRDPRGWVISSAYLAAVDGRAVKPIGADDAAEAAWFDIKVKQIDACRIELCLTNADRTVTALLQKETGACLRERYKTISCENIAFDHAEIIAESLAVLRKNARNLTLLAAFLPERYSPCELKEVYDTITANTFANQREALLFHRLCRNQDRNRNK